MKKLPLAIAAMLCAVAFTACDDDMDPPEIPLGPSASTLKTDVTTSDELIDETLSETSEDTVELEEIVSEQE